MSKLLDLLDLLRKGSAVTDPKLWKDRAALTLALTALILTGCRAAKGFGYEIPISETDAASIAAGVAVLVGLFSTYATSDKVGLLPAKPVPPDGWPDLVRADPEPRATDNAVEQHERASPRDTGGGG
jgi:hypothetical protein